MRHHKINSDEIDWYILLSRIRIQLVCVERWDTDLDPVHNRAGPASLGRRLNCNRVKITKGWNDRTVD
jgi:hypothetical protein